ncbi:hypothetical protein BaRGS_00001023 [Batillaria attramentaria]|uniref:Uncharacterized protein n=1 Tax=Batillaria attramentaria TaxID=370345 RepID=A0ABD0M8C2_9CAEN
MGKPLSGLFLSSFCRYSKRKDGVAVNQRKTPAQAVTQSCSSGKQPCEYTSTSIHCHPFVFADRGHPKPGLCLSGSSPVPPARFSTAVRGSEADHWWMPDGRFSTMAHPVTPLCHPWNERRKHGGRVGEERRTDKWLIQRLLLSPN